MRKTLFVGFSPLCVPTARSVWYCAGGLRLLSLGDLFNFYVGGRS